MKFELKIMSAVVLSSAISITGCKKDPIVPDDKTDSYTIPTTYTFKNANGKSTVDFGGQMQRIAMLDELIEYAETGNTLGTVVSADTLKAMYANTYSSWTDADNLGLVGSGKQLKDKTAGGDAGVQAMFEGYMDSIAKYSNLNYDNSAQAYGNSGVWTNGTNTRLQSGKGFEYVEVIEKSMMCAVFMHQMTVNYLGGVSGDDNTTIVSGKTYTEMQHHWDEAYGYFTSGTDYPTTGADYFWGKYANGREAVLMSGTKIAEAFRKGRAAIDNKDYTVRDVQITIIRNEIEKVCAGTAIHYLIGAKANLTDPTTFNHELSEAVGFINGLRFGYNSINGNSISASEIDMALDYIGDDFSAVTVEKINNAIDLIASKTGLETVKASL